MQTPVPVVRHGTYLNHNETLMPTVRHGMFVNHNETLVPVVRRGLTTNHNETLVPVVRHGVRLANHNETLVPVVPRGVPMNHNETLVPGVRSGMNLGNHNETLVRAGIMDTACAARRPSSRVGRRAETRLNPLGASRKRRQKGDDGTFPRLSLRSSTRRKRPRSRRRSRVRRFRLIPRTSRQPRVVQEVRVGVAPPTRESRSDAGVRPSEWRDPDSNRGHHDFQSCSPIAQVRWICRALLPIWRSTPRPDFLGFCVCFPGVTADATTRRPFHAAPASTLRTGHATVCG